VSPPGPAVRQGPGGPGPWVGAGATRADALFSCRPRGYACGLVTLVALAAWGFGAWERTRVIPFAVMYALPPFTSLVARALAAAGRAGGVVGAAVGGGRARRPKAGARGGAGHRGAWASTLLAAAAVSWAGRAYLEVNADHLGLRVAPRVWPTETTLFLKRRAGLIKPNIYHTNDFGGYLVYHLQEHKVREAAGHPPPAARRPPPAARRRTWGRPRCAPSPGPQVWADTRETIFAPLESWYLNAYDKPPAFHLLVENFGVHAVLTKVAKTRFQPDWGSGGGAGTFVDIYSEFTTPEEWALVAWDDYSVLFLKRSETGPGGESRPVASHAPIISQHEFKVLRPNLPHNNYPVFVEQTPELTALYKEDLQRCQRHMPNDGFW